MFRFGTVASCGWQERADSYRTEATYNLPINSCKTYFISGRVRQVLAPPDVYRYLTQEHDATTVGVLLGMAAARQVI